MQTQIANENLAYSKKTVTKGTAKPEFHTTKTDGAKTEEQT